ncbi:MAG: hypothetical protein J0L84_07940, partial [Verrucomicrobia bacterium]|nr:hypothetical protein [Verrucomicrobiota bacterium]
PGLDSSFVRAVCQGRDGPLWVGTPEGLNRIERSRSAITYAHSSPGAGVVRLPHPNVQALCEDRHGVLWIGTVGGLAAFHRDSGKVELFRADPARPGSLGDDHVQAIHEDPAGRLWLGTLGRGLDEFERGTRTFRHHAPAREDPHRLPSGTVNALFSDRQARLWVGTASGAAWLESADAPDRRFHRVAALEDTAVLSLGESPLAPGVLWIGTAQDGLCRLESTEGPGRFYTRQNSGIPDDTVYGILTDRRGRLWLSTNRGLTCYDPAEDRFRTYGVERGLQSSEFNARAYFLASDGEMFFGGVGGLNSFHPEEIRDNPHAPTVLITDVRVVDRGARRPDASSVSIHDGSPARPARIRNRQRDLAFEFVALHYSEPRLNRYEYRLDGYDPAWHGPLAERRARYTNLDPGDYTFRVRAISSQGVPSAGEATFAFTVLPPFHATAWFRVPLALGLVGALAGAYRFRVRTLRRRQQELSDEVALRTEELRRAMQTVEGQALKLQELDQAKSRFFANLSHEFRTPLMLTLGPLRDVHAGRHGPLPPPALAPIEMAIRQAGRQLELVDQLLLLARLDAGQLEFRPRLLRLDEFLRRLAATYTVLAGRQPVRFDLELPDRPVYGHFDEGQLDHLFGNLLGNAFKFTPPGGSVALRLVVLPEDWAEVEVADTGPGIPEPDLPHLFERFYRSEQSRDRFPGTGLGLAVAKECVEQHGGGIRAQNRAEGGARFSVRLKTVPAPLEDPAVSPPPADPS